MDQAALEKVVKDVIAAVRADGDRALLDFTARWDRVALGLESLRVPKVAIDGADTTSDFARSFERAAERIRTFHAAVKPRSVTVEDPEGARLGLRWTPIRAVGLYVPGGKASYPSTLAMTAIPAQIAGCERIIVVSPPGLNGEVSDEVLLAAKILGVDEIYRVGGAQAIAALAIGTEAIPRVDKIFGPGNAFVAEAKKQLYGEVGIDLLAGPSEVVVYADHSARPRWVAADLMAQAEHDEDTRVTLLASESGVLESVRSELASLLESAPRREVIATALEKGGSFLVVESHEEAARRINQIAPEHLSIQIESPNDIMPSLRNAGAIFLGHRSPVAVGDYYAGPNHVLPTGATARFASCLSVEDFMKRSNVCELNDRFIRNHGENVEVLATGERLPSHAASVAFRREPDAGARAVFDTIPSYQLVEEKGGIKLNQNESPWDIPDEIKDEILAAVREEDWNRYHQSAPRELRAAIAASLSLDEGSVLLGNGSNLLLQWIFEAFAGPGRLALTPSPSFSLYRMWGRLSETRIEEYVLDRGERGLEYPTARIVERIAQTRAALTVLCLPNNPSGSELDAKSVGRIVDAAESVGGWVLIDEAYREFSTQDRLDLVRGGRNVFLLRTFSKALASAGLRIGYALAPAAAADAIEKIIPPFHMSLFNAIAGKVLWSHRELFDARVKELVAERGRVMTALREAGGLEVFDSEANFFMLSLGNAEAVHGELAKRGVLVRKPWKDAMLDNCLRVNIGTPEENDRFLAALGDVLTGTGAGQ